MAKTNNVATKATANKAQATKPAATTKSKEDKIMAKAATKAVATTKAPAKKEVAKVETKKIENAEKKNSFVTIQEATKMYEAAGIKCKNPEAKGNYRIMGSGSSLNIKPQKGYYIYSSDEDLELVQNAKIKASDLVIEKGTNAQDRIRPNTIICTVTDTLVALLKAYALNPKNAVAKEVPATK